MSSVMVLAGGVELEVQPDVDTTQAEPTMIKDKMHLIRMPSERRRVDDATRRLT